MVKLEELQKTIDDYVYDLIVGSKIEDWENNYFSKNNIKIYPRENHFDVTITLDTWKKHEFKIYTDYVFFKFDSNFNKRRKILKIKLSEIKYYNKNYREIGILTKIVESLPLSVKRKEKLKKLEQNEN